MPIGPAGGPVSPTRFSLTGADPGSGALPGRLVRRAAKRKTLDVTLRDAGCSEGLPVLGLNPAARETHIVLKMLSHIPRR